MEMIDGESIRSVLTAPVLVDALRDGFRHAEAITTPSRHHHRLDDQRDATLLIMPAWRIGEMLGVKLVNVFPRNREVGLAGLASSYVLSTADTGQPLAVLDGTELTRLRTAAASALAADSLARADARVHLVVGAGNVASVVPWAYQAVREIELTLVWNRDPASAEALVAQLTREGQRAQVADDLPTAVGQADIVTTATLAQEPLIHRADVLPGTHVDLIGSFTPAMVEADEALVTGSSLFVDVPEATQEAGDLVGPLARGSLGESDVLATLADLTAGRHPGRTSHDEVTVFKSVGTALEDLAAAEAVWRRLRG